MAASIANLQTAAIAYRTLLDAEEKSRGVENGKLVMIPLAEGGFQAGVKPPKPEKTEGAETPGMLAAYGGPSGQMQKARGDQVMNQAGGYVFQISDESRVRRFLILGTAGGTFYVSEKELTMDNLEALITIIEKGYGDMVMHEIREISLAGRNPKQDPLMFALALCARYRVCDVKKTREGMPLSNAYVKYLRAMHRAALSNVVELCRIPTHLFAFVKHCETVAQGTTANADKKSTGWGRALRDTICNWYAQKTPKQLAMAVTKYAKREGWSHRDLFRLSHPKIAVAASDDALLEKQQLYRFIVKGELQTRKRRLAPAELAEEQPQNRYTAEQMNREEASEALNLLDAVKRLKKETPEGEVVEAIKTHGLVREHIPSEHLNSVPVWEALLADMPYNALLRNLSKMQALEMITGPKVAEVCAKITNETAIRQSRIHPIQILTAQHIYEQGCGDKGSLKWKPEKEVELALEKAFYKSFKNVEATGKRFCYAFDVSGSMCSPVLGGSLTCRKGSVAMGMIGLKTEPSVETVAFSGDLTEIPFKKDWTLQQTCDYFDSLDFNVTDCALPMIWARKNNKQIDCFVVFTDNETYFGDVHPFEALRQYRESSGIHDAKLVVCGMRSTDFSIADPNDAGMMDVVGFDAAVPELIANFVKGLI